MLEKINLFYKIFIPILVVASMSFFIQYFSIIKSINDVIGKFTKNSLEQEKEYLKKTLDEKSNHLYNAAEWFKEAPRTRMIFLNRDKDKSQYIVDLAKKGFNVDCFMVADMNRELLTNSEFSKEEEDIFLKYEFNSTSDKVEYNVIGDKLMLTISSKIKEENNIEIGVMIFGINISSEYFVRQLTRGSSVTDACVIVGNKISATTLTDKNNNSLIGTIIDDDHIFNSTNINSKYHPSSKSESDYIRLFTPIVNSKNETIGYILIGTRLLFKQLLSSRVSKELVFISIITIVFFVSTMLFIERNIIIKPLENMKKIVDTIEIIDTDVGNQKKQDIKDEIIILENFFSFIIKQSKNIITNVGEMIEKEGKMVTNVTGKSSLLNETTNDIYSIIVKNNDNNETLDNKIKDAKLQIGDINELILSLTNLIDQKLFDAVNKSSSSIEQMIQSINNIEKITEEKKALTDDLYNIAKTGESKMQNMVRSMEDVGRSNETIMEMIMLIDEVANQTNLLAMNAAIESLHAAEHGKGFGVVADEIKKLAETTTNKAKDISLSINMITDKINIALQNTRETTTSIENIIKGTTDIFNSMNDMLILTREMVFGTEQISETLSDLIEITSDVRSSSNYMEDGIKNMLVLIDDIYAVSKNSKENNIKTNKGIDYIRDLMIELNEASLLNIENLKTLEKEIRRIKIS